MTGRETGWSQGGDGGRSGAEKLELQSADCSVQRRGATFQYFEILEFTVVVT